MKKIIILTIFVLVSLLSLSIVHGAPEEPTISNFTYTKTAQISLGASRDCEAISSTEILCLEDGTKKAYLLNTATAELTNPFNYTIPGANIGIADSCTFFPTDNNLYCINEVGINNQENFKIDVTTGTQIAISNYTPNYGVQTFNACDLRPETDEIFCFGSNEGLSSNFIRSYDISLDTYTNLQNTSYPENPVQKGISFLGCDFRNNNEFWCYGGAVNSTFTVVDTIMQYKVTENITTFFNTQQVMDGHFCEWVNDVFYCLEGADDNIGITVNNITFFDPIDNTTGVLATQFPTGFALYGSGALLTPGNDIFNLGGFSGAGFDDSDTVWNVSFTPTCTEDWVRLSTQCTDNLEEILYQDLNTCGTTNNLPANNGTFVQCSELAAATEQVLNLFVVVFAGFSAIAIFAFGVSKLKTMSFVQRVIVSTVLASIGGIGAFIIATVVNIAVFGG